MGITLRALLIATAGLAAGLLGAGVPAQAQRSIADCEKISDANAYNNCLASFGPRSRGAAGRVVTPTGDAPITEPTTSDAPPPAARSSRSARRGAGRGGRVRAVLQPYGGAYLNVPARPGRVRIEIRRRR